VGARQSSCGSVRDGENRTNFWLKPFWPFGLWHTASPSFPPFSPLSLFIAKASIPYLWGFYLLISYFSALAGRTTMCQCQKCRKVGSSTRFGTGFLIISRAASRDIAGGVT
jgi:hypothetical protein